MFAVKLSAAAVAVALTGFAVVSPSPGSVSEAPPHFDLARSVPAADSMVHAAPTKLQLWFTEAPQEGTTAVRVMNAAEEMIPTGDVAVDPEDATAFNIPFTAPVKAGQYTVTWRAMGSDGHVVTGDFGFRVMIMGSSS